MIIGDPAIDHPDTASLPAVFQPPSEFSDAARAFDNVTGVRPVHQIKLQHVELVVVEIVFSNT
jgi:hypothetical protein